jgi:oxalate decarboxylase/phosphoglucose isomerase-like protein (cupin superfamily)
MDNRFLSPDTASLFPGLYPEQPGLLRHNLVDHPLFELEELVRLAQRMRPVDAEYNLGSLPVGLDPAATPANGLTVEETIRSIEQCGSWMVLKFVEQDAIYRQLLHDVLAELEPFVVPVTGEMLKREGFIFISSPGAVTPFHFDPEHNVLLQLRGRKTMTVFPADDETIAGGAQHEAFHDGGHRNLPWREEFAAKGRAYDLEPGQAIYVPVKAPHWVKNGPEVSVSFSVTWRSRWSYEEADARSLNRLLRKWGIEPTSPRRFPDSNLTKSIAYRAIDRSVRLVRGAGR